jgi:hypothetical protein
MQLFKELQTVVQCTATLKLDGMARNIGEILLCVFVVPTELQILAKKAVGAYSIRVSFHDQFVIGRFQLLKCPYSALVYQLY